MKRYIFFLLLFFFITRVHSQDKLADIGTRKYDTRMDLLVEPQPLSLPAISLPVSNNPASVFMPISPVSTKEELFAELAALKKRYEPFLQNLAPQPVTTGNK